MNKKSIKLFAVSALTFFASSALVNAKTYTSLDALTKDVEAWREEKNAETSDTKEDNNIWVVGKYVFTSNYIFETWADLATAFQSIPTSSKPYIFVIERTYDGLDATGWDIANKTNLFKNAAALPEKVNIQYIDMELIDDAVDNDEAVKSIVDSANNAVGVPENASIYGAYILEIDPETGNIAVSIKKGDVELSAVKNSGVVAELYKLLTSGNYSEIKITDLAENGKTISLKATDTTKTIKEALETLFAGNLKLENFVSKSYEIEFVVANGKVNSTEAERTSYTLSFNKIVDTDKLFATTSDEKLDPSYVFSCKAVEGANCTPVINILKAFTTSGNAGSSQTATPTKYEVISEYIDTIKNMIGTKEEPTIGVKSVNVTIGSTNYTYTSADMTETLVETDLSSALIKLTGKDQVTDITLVDLLGAEITITVNLDGTIAKSQNGKLSETYKINIIGETNSDETVADSAEKLQGKADKSWGYKVEYDETSRTILFRLAAKALLPMSSDSDLVDSLTDLYFSGLYETVTVKSTGAKDFVLGTCGNCVNGSKGVIFTKYVAWLNELTNNKATEDKLNFNLRTLIGKTITIELKPVSDGVVNAGHNSYTIKFVSDANTRVDLENALKTITDTAKYEVKTANNKKTSEYTLDVNTSKLEGVLDPTQRGNLQDAIKLAIESTLYKSITINVLGTDYEITYTAGDETSYGKLNDLMTLLTNTKVSALRGSNVTVTYVLADNVKNADDAELKYTLVLTTVADTNSTVAKKVENNKETSFNIAFDTETKTLTFDLRKPYESVGNIVDAKKTNFANSITEVLATGLYKSLTITFDDEDFVVTYDAAKKEIVGFDALINKIGRSTTLVQLAGKEVTMTFELADGVTDKVTTGKTVEYTIVLSNVVNSLDVVKDQILAAANINEVTSGFRFIIDDNNNIQALYAGDSKLSEVITKSTGLLAAIKTTFDNDERISSYTLKIGDTSITIDRDSTKSSDEMNKIKKAAIIALINSTKLLNTENDQTIVDEANYETKLLQLGNIQLETLASKIRETNTEISLSINLVEGKAVNELDDTTAKYNVKLSMFTSVDSRPGNIKVNTKGLSFVDHKAVVKVTNNDQTAVSFDISDFMTSVNNYKFASVSFEIGSANVNINKAEFGAYSTKLTEINNAIKALAGVTGNTDAKLSNLIGKSIKVTINTAENVVSEYGRTSETYTISFVATEA